MIKRIVLLLCVLTLGLGSFAFADEGMWLFNAFPKDKVQAKYGFAPTRHGWTMCGFLLLARPTARLLLCLPTD